MGESGGGNCGVNQDQPGVWYKVLGIGKPIVASLCNTVWDSKISVYEGSCEVLTCIGGNDDDGPGCTGNSASFSWNAAMGNTYFIKVHGGSSDNAFNLNLSCQEPEDNIDPVALCKDINIELDATGNASIVGGDIDNGSNDASGIASLVASPDAFTCVDVGPNMVVLTVTDNYNNVSTCTATVMVGDNVPPVAICQPVTVELDASGNGAITTADVDNGSNDACGIASLSLDDDSFTCADVAGQVVTMTVNDNNGNSSSCTANVTVNDNVLPEALCQNVTVQLDASGNGSTTAAAVDAGSNDACDIQSVVLSQTAFDCTEVGANAEVLTVTDVNGNVNSCNVTVTVEDNVAPIFSTCPTSFTLTLPPGECETIATYPAPTATDNCVDVVTLQTTGLGSGQWFDLSDGAEH
jgi:hypothetical protein